MHYFIARSILEVYDPEGQWKKVEVQQIITDINPLNANPEKWSNTLKQIVGDLPTICLSVFDHFMNVALKGLRKSVFFI